MAFEGIIPQSKSGIDAFLERLDQGEKSRLMQAQTQHAYAQADTSRMLANLLNGSGAGGTTGQGGMNVNRALLASGALHLPTQVVEGQLITPFGNFKVGESPQEKSTRETKTKGQEQLQKETTESAYGALPLNASFEAMDKILKDPEYRENAGSAKSYLLNSKPYGLPLGSMLQKNLPSIFPSSVVKKLSSSQVHMGNIVVGVQQKFKGPFKNLTAGYVDSMKPTPLDSADVQEAKINQLRLLSDLGDRQNELITQLTKNGMDPTEAVIESAKQLMPEFKKLVGESVGSEQGQPPAASQQPANQNYSPENLSNQPEAKQEGIANVPAPQNAPTPTAAGNPDDMVYGVIKTKNGTKKIKMKRAIAEAIKSGKLKYAG